VRLLIALLALAALAAVAGLLVNSSPRSRELERASAPIPPPTSTATIPAASAEPNVESTTRSASVLPPEAAPAGRAGGKPARRKSGRARPDSLATRLGDQMLSEAKLPPALGEEEVAPREATARSIEVSVAKSPEGGGRTVEQIRRVVVENQRDVSSCNL